MEKVTVKYIIKTFMNISHQSYKLQQCLMLVIVNFLEGGRLRLKHLRNSYKVRTDIYMCVCIQR